MLESFDAPVSTASSRLDAISARESATCKPLLRVLGLLLMVIFLSLVRGGRQGKSVAGVEHCTSAYWGSARESDCGRGRASQDHTLLHTGIPCGLGSRSGERSRLERNPVGRVR